MNAESVIHIVKRAGPAARAMLDGLGHRAQLALLELSDLRDKIAASLLFGVAALVLSLLGGIALTFAIAASVWHREDRGLWLALLTLAYFAAAAFLAWAMVKRLKRLEFLPETSRQLNEDRVCLGVLLHQEQQTARASAP